MNKYTFVSKFRSMALTVIADSENEAVEEFRKAVNPEYFDSFSLECVVPTTAATF